MRILAIILNFIILLVIMILFVIDMHSYGKYEFNWRYYLILAFLAVVPCVNLYVLSSGNKKSKKPEETKEIL